MNKSNTGSQRDYIVEINEANTHEEIKSSDCRKIKFQKSFETPNLIWIQIYIRIFWYFLENKLNDTLCDLVQIRW